MTMTNFQSNVKEVKDATEKALLRAAEVIGGTAEGYAKKLCRVDTGLLRNSITHGLEGGKPSIMSYKADRGDGKGEYSGTIPKTGDQPTVVIGSNVEYAPYIELGTRARAEGANGEGLKSGIAPSPYLRPAIEDHKEEYKQILAAEFSGLK